jgi:DUF1009 family protein
MSRLALIAGSGGLPLALVRALAEVPLVAAVHGFAPDNLTPDMEFRLERLIPFLHHLQDQGVTEVAFAGAVRRPRLDPALIDPQTAQILPRIMAAMGKGDDGALREIIALMEEAGLTVRGVKDIAPDLVPGQGVLTGAPTAQDDRDAVRAEAILQALSSVDLGQGCVVAGGQCLAVEVLCGTDAMLAEVARIDPGLRLPAKGLFYKASKLGQDLRIDLPTLGPTTVQAVANAGLGGIAFAAGGVICLDLPQMQAIAAAKGLFLWAR